MPVSHFRPIRPRSTTNQEGLVVAEFKSSTIEIETKTERRSSIACRECQRRRTKCTGGNQCSECQRRNYICIFDASSDKRRKGYIKKTEQELLYYQEFVESFFEAIRTSHDDKVQHIIDIVRSGSSIASVRTEVALILAENRFLRDA